MGGLAPGIGGLEILVIGLLALIVVGPKDLPLLLRKVGQAVGKARSMANEFRSSFDEIARQSELDELRKEVEALRTGQGLVPLGAEADAAFREIRHDLNPPVDDPAPAQALSAPDEWPDNPPVMQPLETPVALASKPKSTRPKTKPKAKTEPSVGSVKGARASSSSRSSKSASGPAKPAASKIGGKPSSARSKEADS